MTSPGKVTALPDEWSERIFMRMENFYGAKWVNSLGGIERERVREAWGEELFGFSANEISRGIEACRSLSWPPTLPEFMMLCRPATRGYGIREPEPKPKVEPVPLDEAKQRAKELVEQVRGFALPAPSTKWAVDLLRREAAGEAVAFIAFGAWREVLRFDDSITAQAALASLESRVAA